MLKDLFAVTTTLAVTCGLLLAACSGMTDAAVPTSDEVALDQARARWRERGSLNYSFKSVIDCYCNLEIRAPKTVTVRNGVVVSVADRVTGAVDASGKRLAIDSMFALVRRELALRPTNALIEYDPLLGYPRLVTSGMPESDAGSFIQIDSVVLLPR